MLKTFGRSLWHFFVRPEPTSVALMVGQMPNAANDDQAQLLRRAMQAASVAEPDPVNELVVGAPQLTIVAGADARTADAELAEEAADIATMFRPYSAEPVEDVEPPATAPVLTVIENEAYAAPEPSQAVEPEVEERADFADTIAEEAADFTTLEEPDEAQAEPVIASVEENAPAEDIVALEERAADATDAIESEPDSEFKAAPEPEVVAAEDAVLPVEEAVEEPETKKARKKKTGSPRKKAPGKSRKAKAADAPAEPVPEDDVWVSDAVAWSLNGEWIDGEWRAPEDEQCPRRLEEFRAMAAEGRLTIWGRSDDAGVWRPIDPSYWKSGAVALTSFAEGRENLVAEPGEKTKGKRKANCTYSALKVSRSQVEELWLQGGATH